MSDNLTLFEEDPFLDTEDAEKSDSEFITSTLFFEIFFVVIEFARFAFCLATFSCASFFLYIMKRFDNLKSVYNKLLFYFAIAVAINSSAVPVFEIANSLIYEFFEMHLYGRTYCIFYQIIRTVACVKLCLIYSLVIYWYFDNYKSEWLLMKFEKLKIMFYGMMCFVNFAHLSASLMFCSRFHNFDIAHYVLLFILVSLFITIVTVNVLRYKKTSTKTESRYYLTICSWIVFCYLPEVLTSEYIEIIMTRTISYTLMIVYPICYIITYLDMIFVVCLLRYRNRYFKMAYRSVFQCSIKNYHPEDLDETSEHDDGDRRVLNRDSTLL